MAKGKATKADGRRFVDQAFRDRISWTAARVLLARVAADTGDIDPELRTAIGRFLEAHPDPHAMIDVLACEPHFADHLRPVWNALPPELRGAFVRDDERNLPDPSRPIVVASYGDNLRARQRGYRRIAAIEHGIGQSYAGADTSEEDRIAAIHHSYPGGEDRGDVGLFMVPNDHAAGRWRARYPRARVEVIGSPRLDSLPAREPGPTTVAVSFHWDSRFIAEARTGYWLWRDAVAKLARRRKVIGHGHPRLFAKGGAMLPGWWTQHGIEPVRSFDEVCRRADVYVCDNSSTLYEFASTGRNVVVIDVAVYRPSVHHGLRFWDAADVGPRIRAQSHLEDAVKIALAGSPATVAAREAALDVVYAYRTGAAERAARAIVEWSSGIILPPG